MPSDPLPEPWRSFLRDLDTQAAGSHRTSLLWRIRCGAVLRSDAAHSRYRHPGERGHGSGTIAKPAGRTSALHKRHGLYVDVVTVADVPDKYDERVTTARDALFEKLRFRVFERHHFLLAKIVRNNDKDRADVAAIAGGPGLDIDLRARYVEELRPKLGRPEREDLTLELWIDIIEETRQRRQG